MTVKASPRTDPVRIRDNQRRSRARQKEYIQSLEQRIQTFERQGVQATLEMQMAAQKTAEENALLRSLLRRRGVAETELEIYLRGTYGKQATTPSPTVSQAVRKCSVRESPLLKSTKISVESPKTAPERQISETVGQYHARQSSSPKTPDESIQQFSRTPVTSANKSQESPSIEARHRPGLIESQAAPRAAPAGRKPDITIENDMSSSSQERPSDDATSCEEAASIIASMRGHGDAERARAELGCCPPNESCRVKNTTIFEMMDG